jgi:hypothetical protein
VRTVSAVDLDPNDYRSVNSYLRKLESDDLRILREKFEALEANEDFKRLLALVTLDREQHVRNMTTRKLDADERTWEAGYVRGDISVFAILATVKAFDVRVQAALDREERESQQDGET